MDMDDDANIYLDAYELHYKDKHRDEKAQESVGYEHDSGSDNSLSYIHD